MIRTEGDARFHLANKESMRVSVVRMWKGWWKRGSSRYSEIIRAPWKARCVRRRSPRCCEMLYRSSSKTSSKES